MPDLFIDFLADVCCDSELNGIFRISMSHGMVTLLKKDSNKVTSQMIFQPISAELKILAKVSAKML